MDPRETGQENCDRAELALDEGWFSWSHIEHLITIDLTVLEKHENRTRRT
jgi:hypothetical protein